MILFGPIEISGIPFAAKFDDSEYLYRGHLTKTLSGHMQVLKCVPYLPTDLANRVYEAYERHVQAKKARRDK